MTNDEYAARSEEFHLSFELGHSFVIRASSFVIRQQNSKEKLNTLQP